MLILTIEADLREDFMVEARIAQLLFESKTVDLVRVNTIGVGFGIAEHLKSQGVKVEEFNPAAKL